ncbi:23S rRNA (adenine(2503)-C(2))-methyltransferase RlmN [Bdellovibrio sp. BCCA]|uniref:23S rRNA (adenine(2503)-C(2))-methyltransferase RlmN n=1 Tax=Bdellovibrio sp. BCCA TaxID=3136281 RepID=UPI0030F05626
MELNNGGVENALSAPVNYADDNVAKPLENKPVNFYSMTLEDLKAYLKGKGKEQFRAQQIFKWVYEQRITDPEQMTNLSKEFRASLPQLLSFELPKVLTHLKSVDGTQKLLFDMGNGQSVEAVLIPSEDRLTLCISSEVGCNIGCKFCFTGKQKLKRRLRTEEIVGQFMQCHDRMGDGQRITNIVFMGMGEPLDNPEAVFKTIDVIHSPWGINLSRKKITVSTSGIVPEMWRVADAKVRLAVSLNGPTDEIRSQVMPINKKWNTTELLNACKEYCRITKDKVTFEYVLLKGVTDQIEHARQLVKLVKDVPCKINIIPFNEHPGSGYERPSDEAVEAFHSELMRLGAHVLLRRSMGRDIFAACGQLTSQVPNKPETMDISNSKLAGLPKYKREMLAAAEAATNNNNQ